MSAEPALEIIETAQGAVFAVRVAPKSSRDALEAPVQGALKVRLTAPPVDGAANKALQKFLGKALGLAPSRVEIVAGHTGRLKRVLAQGLDADQVRRLLGV